VSRKGGTGGGEWVFEGVLLGMSVKESWSEPGEPFQTDLENSPLAVAFEFSGFDFSTRVG